MILKKKPLSVVFTALVSASPLSVIATNTPVIPGMPVVPANIVTPAATDKAPTKPKIVEDAENAPSGSNVPKSNSSFIEIEAKPGVNEIITIAKGHLNRIVTPFSNPSVRTSSQATTEIKNGVIYVVSDTSQPVTMFITAKGSEEAAVSLTLVPRAVPPKEIKIKLPEDIQPLLAKTNIEAEKFERNQPYVETLTKILTSLAKGEVPNGYGISNTKPSDIKLPYCEQNGIRFTFNGGQRIDGGKYIGYIGLAENISATALEMQENSCISEQVVAVSTYPHFVVQPQQKTEVFVIMRRDEPNYVQKRRSLVSG